MAIGFLLSAPFVPWAAWIAGIAAIAGVLLWAVSIWTGLAPDGLVWPGRPTARPHRPVSAVGVWFLAAGWALVYWSASWMSSPEPPTVATLLSVSAALLVVGGLIIGLAQRKKRRSWVSR